MQFRLFYRCNRSDDLQDDFPEVGIRLHQFLCQHRVSQREHLVNDRLDLAFVDQRPDVFLQVSRYFRLEFIRARTQGRTGYHQLSVNDLRQIDGTQTTAQIRDHR